MSNQYTYEWNAEDIDGEMDASYIDYVKVDPLPRDSAVHEKHLKQETTMNQVDKLVYTQFLQSVDKTVKNFKQTYLEEMPEEMSVTKKKDLDMKLSPQEREALVYLNRKSNILREEKNKYSFMNLSLYTLLQQWSTSMTNMIRTLSTKNITNQDIFEMLLRDDNLIYAGMTIVVCVLLAYICLIIS